MANTIERFELATAMRAIAIIIVATCGHSYSLQ